MSLFKAREFWISESESDNDFDQNSLQVARLNDQFDYVIIGSHSGLLRVYKPSKELDENGMLIGYKPTDLLIEKRYPFPILQIECGKLVSGSQSAQIAILHPMSVRVCNFLTKEGATDYATQTILKTMYEHNLRRSAYNLVVGPFGGATNRDFICVQSLDGSLTFFEQESFSFCCFLSQFLLPGPIIYCNKTDSFITVGSNWSAQSFKYKRISEVGENSKQEDIIGAKIEPEWSFNLGEAAIDIQYLQCPNKNSCLLILTEKNYYCLSDGGLMKFMKRFDFIPICFYCYVSDNGNEVMSLIVSETNTILIYENTTLKWAAQITFMPISVKRAFLENMAGALVLLSEEGKIACCYLGSEPQKFSVPPLMNQELDFAKAEEELTRLNRAIKNTYVNERELELKISTNPHLFPCEFAVKSTSNPQGKMCEVTVDLLPQAPLEEVHVSFEIPAPLRATKRTELLTNFHEKMTIKNHIFVKDMGEIPSLILKVVVSYISNLSVPRVVKKTINLPLNLVAQTCVPLKEAEHKVTLIINRTQIPLSTLFPEFTGENNFTSSSTAIGFHLFGLEQHVVTLLSAKSSQRYRIQANSFTFLTIFVQECIDRLKKYFCKDAEFTLSSDSSLPTKELIELVRKHHEARRIVLTLQKELEQLSEQFRVIQKRLIAKFKDKNPTPLNNLDKLFNITHKEIMETTSALEKNMAELEITQNELTCGLELIVGLCDVMEINLNIKDLFRSAMNSTVYDMDGQNWEDVFDGGLCYLLTTILAKSERDQIKAGHASFEEIKELSKLEKHLTQIFERVSKAGHSLNAIPITTEPVENKFNNDEEKTKSLVPIGSSIGEASSRALSARKSLLRRRQQRQIEIEETI